MWFEKNVEEISRLQKKIEHEHLQKHGMDITVIDDSDYVGWAAAATRLNEIYMSDVKSMVAGVLKKKKKYKIRRLNILDHGNAKSLQIGKDWVKISTLKKFEPELSKLNGEFNASGFVHLQHCDIGLNKDLLKRLAKIFGVAVYAGTGAHNPVYRFNFGDYVVALPNGRYRTANRPGIHVRQIYPEDLETVEDPNAPGRRYQGAYNKTWAKESPKATGN